MGFALKPSSMAYERFGLCINLLPSNFTKFSISFPWKILHSCCDFTVLYQINISLLCFFKQFHFFISPHLFKLFNFPISSLNLFSKKPFSFQQPPFRHSNHLGFLVLQIHSALCPLLQRKTQPFWFLLFCNANSLILVLPVGDDEALLVGFRYSFGFEDCSCSQCCSHRKNFRFSIVLLCFCFNFPFCFCIDLLGFITVILILISD